MGAGTMALVGLGVVGAGVGLYLVTRSRGEDGYDVPPAGPGSSSSGLGALFESGESVAAKVTGVPLAQIGAAAQGAPLWLKVGVLPVGVTALTQSFISHPSATAKKVAGAAVTVGKVPVAAVTGAASAVASTVTGLFGGDSLIDKLKRDIAEKQAKDAAAGAAAIKAAGSPVAARQKLKW